jgi:hypothetical protein
MSRVRVLSDPDHLPALDRSFVIDRPALGLGADQPPPRILLLYGSLRERSFSRLCVEEAARLLQMFGAETRIFDRSTCRCSTRPSATTIPPSTICASCRCGARDTSGAAPSGTVRSPA